MAQAALGRMTSGTPLWAQPFALIGRSAGGFFAAFGRFGQFLVETGRSTKDVGTWGPLLLEQMKKLGVDSIPIALFLASFTGIVLALQASYTFTGAIPLYF